MSFMKPKYTEEQKAAIKRGVGRGQKVQPVGMGLKSVIAKAFRKTAAPKIKTVATQFFRNDIPGTQGYSAGYVKGKRIK